MALSTVFLLNPDLPHPSGATNEPRGPWLSNAMLPWNPLQYLP